MKKIISLLLILIIIMTLAIPAFAATVNDEESKSQIPIIRVLGDGEPLYDAEGNKLFHLRTSFTDGSIDADEGGSALMESSANVLFPFLVNGLLNDDWDEYYENLEKEIGELTGDAKLDCNGNPVEGTGISKERQEYLEYARTHDKKGEKGYYGMFDYHFWYDWRLDPFVSAEKLHEYIQDIKDITGCKKVSIMASCIGTIVTTTYIKAYGTDDLHGVGFTGSIANGAEVLSETISGKFDVNSMAINRILSDSDYLELFNLSPLVSSLIDLLTSSGVIELIEDDIRKNLYDRLVQGVTSALALSTLYTYPSYWAAVSAEDYEDALNHVFGPEGSEKRKEYAGLISIIENYDDKVRANFKEIISSIGENGVNFGAISKYGFQILPICESYYAVSDQFVSVKRSSFGATTSTIYDTLSDDYIAKQEELGLGKYISPDKQIDASTCLYPASTWFVKNSSHSEYTAYEKKILYDVVSADKQLTVDDFEWSQFMVYDYDTDTMAKMTEENCHTEKWDATEENDSMNNIFLRLINFVKSIINFFTQLLKKIF